MSAWARFLAGPLKRHSRRDVGVFQASAVMGSKEENRYYGWKDRYLKQPLELQGRSGKGEK
jgi:hypothetical protein